MLEDYSELYEKALVIEKTAPGKASTAGQPNSPQKGKFDGKTKGGNWAQRSHGGSCFPPSGTCGQNHPGKCRITNRGCYKCGSYNHVVKDCPRRQQQ